MYSSLKRRSFLSATCIYISLFFLIPHVYSQLTPEELIITSGRPTFADPITSVPGKIALEEHVGNTLFSGAFTTPFVNFTNEINYDIPIYADDSMERLMDINSRVQAMDAANISISILMFGVPGIQGVFNTTFATFAASFVNNEVSRIYARGNFSSRFGFWCSNALQDVSVLLLLL